jgi:branched-chain amino acid transport system substrate-binding protein
MELCRNALRTLGVSLIIGLGFFSGALAQSGNPIRIGMSLALTGAGASPSKVINTALDIWRDDINAKGGLLGRPVELVIYDDQSAPANVPTIYTKLITVDKVDLLLGPYGTNFVAPAMPTIIQNNTDDQLHRDRHQRQIQLPEILLDGVGWAGGRRCVLDWLL